MSAVFGSQPFEANDAVRNALHLQIALVRREIIEQQHRAAPAGKELLQREHLPPVAQRIRCQQLKLGERVQHHPRWLPLFDISEDPFRRVSEFYLGGVKHRVLLCRIEGFFGGRQLAHEDAVQRPAMRPSDDPRFLFGLRERYVQGPFPAVYPFEQELHRQCRLSRAGHAFKKVQPVRGQAAV